MHRIHIYHTSNVYINCIYVSCLFIWKTIFEIEHCILANDIRIESNC